MTFLSHSICTTAQLNFFSHFEFPATTFLCTHKNPKLILTRSPQIAPPWSTKKCDLGKTGQNKSWFFAYGERPIAIFGIFAHCDYMLIYLKNKFLNEIISLTSQPHQMTSFPVCRWVHPITAAALPKSSAKPVRPLPG